MLVAREGRRSSALRPWSSMPTVRLLRSVAVDARRRGRHVGHQLTEAALQLGERAWRSRRCFLLTTTAESSSRALVSSRSQREDVPPSVRASVEFTSACPASAVVMRKRLAGDRWPRTRRRLSAEAVGHRAAADSGGWVGDHGAIGCRPATRQSRSSPTPSRRAPRSSRLILTFGPISGAHFNPAVTIADASQGGLAWREVPATSARRSCGARAWSVGSRTLMFGEPLFMLSPHVAQRPRADVQRVRRDASACWRSSGAVPGRRTDSRCRSQSRPTSRGILVYRVDFVRKSGGRPRTRPDATRSPASPTDVPGFIVAQFAGARCGDRCSSGGWCPALTTTTR